MLGCDRTEIRTAWLFIHKGGLELFLEALAPNQDPEMIRKSIKEVLAGNKEVVWK